MKRALAAMVLLAACTQEPGFVPGGFRDQAVAITSSTRFDAKRFSGDWRVIESFEQVPRSVTVTQVGFEPVADGFRYVARGAPSPLDAIVDLSPDPVLTLGQFGRFSYPEDAADPIWVLWVDEEHRTAVLGTPSGSFGMIVNRTTSIRRDRLKSAREVLTFNGYDISKLRRVTP